MLCKAALVTLDVLFVSKALRISDVLCNLRTTFLVIHIDVCKA